MSSPKGDNMGKVGKGAPEPQQPRAVGPYRGLVIRNDDFSIGLGLDFTEPLNPWFLQKIEPKTHHPTNASEPRAPVCSEPGKKNSLITPSPEMATKPLAFAPAVDGSTCSNGVLNGEDAAAEMNGSNDIDLDLKL